MSQSAKPGLRKTHAAELFRRRRSVFIESSDYRVRELFERADVMSEGATRREERSAVYYGSSSIVLGCCSRGGLIPDAELEEITTLLRNNPHARVRAVRIACREAQIRAGSPLAQLRTELQFRQGLGGIQIDVDVEALLASSSLLGGRTK